MCVCEGEGEEGGWLGVVRPNRAAPRPDPSPRGCPPYAPRAGGSQPAPRGAGLGRSVAWPELSLDVTPEPAAAFTVSVSFGVLCNRLTRCRVMHVDLPTGA